MILQWWLTAWRLMPTVAHVDALNNRVVGAEYGKRERDFSGARCFFFLIREPSKFAYNGKSLWENHR
jgi:hypothetical protein